MADDLVCGRCGRRFVLPEAVLRRYPGWRPTTCMGCRGQDRPELPPAGAADLPAAAGRRTPGDGIYTDGACLGNPGPGGWAVVVVAGGRAVAEHSGGEPATTNNRMELRALIEGLKMVPEDGQAATIYSDSQLVVQTLTKWAADWERRGWRRREGPVKNLDLVREAWALVKARPQVRLEWLRGHAGNRWNERADALANASAGGRRGS